MDCLRTGKSWRMVSTSNAGTVVLVAMLMEFFKQEPFQRFPELLRFDAVDDVLCEGVGENIAGGGFINAARLEVEERFGIELADGGAVGAFHVVGPDLKLGFGVDDGFVG